MAKEDKKEYKTYRFKPDTFTSIVTIVVLLILISTSVFSFIKKQDFSYWIIAIIVIVIFMTISQCFVSITLGKGFVRINKIIGSITIDNIEDIKIINKKEIGFSIRKFGNGGFMGFWGHFYSHKIGNFRVWAINLNKLVLIKTKDGKKIVTNYPYEMIGKI